MASSEYLQKVLTLDAATRAELEDRFIQRLGRKAGYARLQPTERAALQLQTDEQALDAWRQNIAALKARDGDASTAQS